MSHNLATHHRVGVFYSVEVQEEVQPGEWMRDSKKSTKPLADIVNKFLEEKGVVALSISPPTINLVSKSPDNKIMTYRCGVSVIYAPAEVVYDQETAPPETNSAAPCLRAETNIDLDS